MSFNALQFFVLASSFLFTVQSRPTGVHLRNMAGFIRAVQQVEDSNPGLSPLALIRALRKTAGHDDMMTIHFLGSSSNQSEAEMLEPAILNTTAFSFFDKAIHHIVTAQGEERGVVLAPDGTTVALAPLLLGIESGLKAKVEGTPDVGIFPLTLGRPLGLSFLSLQDFPPSTRLGPDGCWDNVDLPKMFKLSRSATLATDAIINGGMDGVILGTDIGNRSASQQLQPLSEILKGYYSFSLSEGQGLDAVIDHISPRRREISRAILEPLDLNREVMETLKLVWKLEKTEWIAFDTGVEKAVKDGLQAFVHKYWDCPQIIPRCQWGAKNHRGTPLPLSLPLRFLFVHHTYEPSSPCLNFSSCSKDMRSMQRFHQEDRGWSDIGYSFVVGSDGYIYEGKGWNLIGTHTRRRNSVGYGVSVIGNYTSTLPSRHAMDLLRHRLVQCAVDGGKLAADFTIQGHRQVVNYTTCPGERKSTRKNEEVRRKLKEQVERYKYGHPEEDLNQRADAGTRSQSFYIPILGRPTEKDTTKMGYGNIMRVETTGASWQTAQQDGLGCSGVQASHTMAQTDADRMKAYRSKINRVGAQNGIDPALIAAIISRETRAGNAIRSTGGWGDHGNAWGLMQVDVNPNGGGHTARGAWDSEEHLNQATGILVYFLGRISKKFPSWNKEQQLKGGIAAYNMGDGNVRSYEGVDARTTGGDYSNDVVARAQWYKNNCGY
ncbi:N-acetylmuramoyl-L-alanine amidase-like isoform X1 [Xyrichtys novacula]|uniref:Lysozyme g n=1 Tax=Xyrichtys novacula TaxID=13765 RepID=A0AAV1EXQ9_XYRNO|nr:N-acetylmuramoyl-L-alanine amidase-like isoform X1 [Xyrichtys novacula]